MNAWFDRFAAVFVRWASSPLVGIPANLLLALWLIAGPAFHWSDSFMLVGNTWMSAVSYVLLFAVLSAQVRETAAMKLQMAEVLRALPGARNALIAAELMSPEMLRAEAERLLALAEE